MNYKYVTYKDAIIHIWLLFFSAEYKAHRSLLYLLSPDPMSKVKVFHGPQVYPFPNRYSLL